MQIQHVSREENLFIDIIDGSPKFRGISITVQNAYSSDYSLSLGSDEQNAVISELLCAESKTTFDRAEFGVSFIYLSPMQIAHVVLAVLTEGLNTV